MTDKAKEAVIEALGGEEICGDTKCLECRARVSRAIAAYERAMWRPIEECPEEWKDGRQVLVEFVHANAQYSDDPIKDGWIAVHEACWVDHNGGGWTWHGLCGVTRRVRPLPSAPEGK